MSRYFQTLKKLQQQRDEDTPTHSTLAAQPLPQASAPLPKWEPESPDQVFPELPLAHREAAWNHMLESLRSQSQSAQPILVVAGVSDVESTRRLVAGLRRQAQQRGISVLAARLTQSREGRILSFLPPAPDEADSPWQGNGAEENQAELPSVKGFDLSVANTDQKLAEWLRASSTGSDMVVIEAPGILSSADTLLLSKACDGLALVVEPLVTDRSALKAAVTRAQASGCKVAGLIVNGHRNWLPRWLRRLLSDS